MKLTRAKIIMKNKLLPISLAVFLIIVIIGLGYFLVINYVKNNSDQISQGIIDVKTNEKYIDTIVEECKKNTTDMKIMSCIEQKALDEEVVELCDKIKSIKEIYAVGIMGENSYSVTRDFCYVKVATKMGNINICSDVNEEKMKIECFTRVAEEKGDIKICNKIGDSNKKEWCLYFVANKINDYSICDNLTKNTTNDLNNVRDICYENIAPKINNPQLCVEIVSSPRQEKCYKGLISKNKELLGLDFCQEFNNQEDKDSCLLSLSESISEIYVCDEVGDDKQKEICYKRMALRNKDGELCSKLSILSEDECYCEVSFKVDDFDKKNELVNKIKNLNYVGEIREFNYICINEIVKKTGEKELCDKILNTEAKTRCSIQ